MKKLIKYVPFFLLIFVSSSCTKNNTIESFKYLDEERNLLLVNKELFLNCNNQNDSLNIGIIEASISFREFLNSNLEIFENLDEEEYVSLYLHYLNQSFSFDTEYLVHEDDTAAISILKELFLEIISSSEESILQTIVNTECNILENSVINNETKLLLLYNLSVYKLTYSGFVNIIIPEEMQTWEEFFDDCMRARLDAIFSNPISTIQFFLNPPANFAWVVGACIYEATILYNNQN